MLYAFFSPNFRHAFLAAISCAKGRPNLAGSGGGAGGTRNVQVRRSGEASGARRANNSVVTCAAAATAALAEEQEQILDNGKVDATGGRGEADQAIELTTLECRGQNGGSCRSITAYETGVDMELQPLVVSSSSAKPQCQTKVVTTLKSRLQLLRLTAYTH